MKPRYRIFFYEDGPPKSAISDDLICLWSYPVYGDNYPHPHTDSKELIAILKQKNNWQNIAYATAN